MISIHRARPREFAAIAALDRIAWRGNANSEYIPDGEHAWRLWVEHGLVFCAESEVEIIGAILAFPTLSGDWVVHKAFVREDHCGQGVGTVLFAALLDELDELNVAAFLTVDPYNAAAIALYERMGFTEKRFVAGYYRDSEDRWVMRRRACGS